MVVLEKAESYLAVSHGKEHSLYKVCNVLLHQCREEQMILDSRGRTEQYSLCK
uniref:Uncharacterized protein n=1 Tax=Romanomermis culicivorax TaxID=13658 RepID=A0A915KT92_ROMCU